VQLLRSSRHGDRERFNERLVGLAGMDPATLDSEVRAWLTAPGHVLFRMGLAEPRPIGPDSWDEDTSRAGYEGGEYYVVKLDQNDRPKGPAFAPPVADFAVEIDARLITPAPGGYAFLGFRRQEDTRRYEFAVNPANRAFRLRVGTGSDWTSLIDWTPAPAIHGGQARNRIGVRVQGADFVLLVNGQVVARTRHDLLTDGAASFGVGSSGEAPVEGRFSDLVVSNP